MRLLQWALLGLTGATAAADSNLTYESRNILPATFAPPKHFRNVNLVRNINLEKSYPKETVNVVIENIDSKPQSEYYLPVEQGLLGRVGGMEVKDKKDAANTGFLVEVVGIDPARYAFLLLRYVGRC
jgi:oligosaccharyltransferase complex subunit alpha (ribophorin I)